MTDDSVYGRELWISDGSVGGTFRVTDANSGAADGGGFPVAALDADHLLFWATDGLTGLEPWATDVSVGTAAFILNLNPSTFASDARWLVRYGGSVMFFGDDGFVGDELWLSDGTTSGTELVLDIYPGVVSSFSSFLGVAGDSPTLARDRSPVGNRGAPTEPRLVRRSCSSIAVASARIRR